MATISRYSFILAFQVLLIILFAVFVKYDKVASTVEAPAERSDAGQKEVFTTVGYAMFQDVHVMIFIGFAFLMTFLKRYGYSATGFNLFLSAVAIQWAVICTSIADMEDGKITLTMGTLMNADIAAATVLIAMGALLGRTTGPQLLIMTILEIMLFAVNEYISIHMFSVADCGGSIAVHIFGAYFGLGVSLILSRSKVVSEAPAGSRAPVPESLEGSSYNSDITAMIGTLFLWVFWPSFNAGIVTTDAERYRAVTNTYLSLASATVVAFAASAWVLRNNKFDMVHVQNSTLAGGVAIGAVSNMAVMPFGALIIGSLSGLLSVFGYHKLTPFMDRKFNIKDTCGVHNLHGTPGILSGIASIIFAVIASTTYYDENDMYNIFPAMAPGTPDENGVRAPGRSGCIQAVFQLAAIGVTLAISIVGGIITGCILKRMPSLKKEKLYNDDQNWHLEDDTNKADTEKRFCL